MPSHEVWERSHTSFLLTFNKTYLPARPDFKLEKEIKNVITVVAKTHHYLTEHCLVLY